MEYGVSTHAYCLLLTAYCLLCSFLLFPHLCDHACYEGQFLKQVLCLPMCERQAHHPKC